MYCGTCGNKLTSGDKFCCRCGAVVEDIPVTNYKGTVFTKRGGGNTDQWQPGKMVIGKKEYFQTFFPLYGTKKARKLSLIQKTIFWLLTVAGGLYCGATVFYMMWASSELKDVAKGQISSMIGLVAVVMIVFFLIWFASGYFSCKNKGVILAGIYVFLSLFGFGVMCGGVSDAMQNGRAIDLIVFCFGMIAALFILASNIILDAEYRKNKYM